jgi:hypothetical protein
LKTKKVAEVERTTSATQDLTGQFSNSGSNQLQQSTATTNATTVRTANACSLHFSSTNLSNRTALLSAT